MKRFAILFLIILPFTLALIQCDPTENMEDPALEDPEIKSENLVGTWQVIKIEEQDQIAIEEGATLKEMDITDVMPEFLDYQITFNSDGTFSVNSGEAPNYIDTAGTWKLNDETVPTKILLTAQDSTHYTSYLRLGNTPLSWKDQVILKYERYCNEEHILNYKYTMERQ